MVAKSSSSHKVQRKKLYCILFGVIMVNNVSRITKNFEKESEEIFYHTYDTISVLLDYIKMEIDSRGLEDMGFLAFGDEIVIAQMSKLSDLKVYPESKINVEENQKLIDEFKPVLDEQITKLDNFNVDEADQLATFKSYLYENMQDALESCILELGKIRAGLNAIDARSNLNLFRQSFILTVALFDALFSDVLKLIVLKNFFGFINVNEKNVKNKMESLYGYSSFESFQEAMANNIIDNSQIRLLIMMLYKFNHNYFIVGGKDIYLDIIEILARRNVHLHRKGFADKGYFEQATCETYSFSSGDYLPISHTYYNHAYETLNAFMSNLDND